MHCRKSLPVSTWKPVCLRHELLFWHLNSSLDIIVQGMVCCTKWIKLYLCIDVTERKLNCSESGLDLGNVIKLLLWINSGILAVLFCYCLIIMPDARLQQMALERLTKEIATSIRNTIVKQSFYCIGSFMYKKKKQSQTPTETFRHWDLKLM